MTRALDDPTMLDDDGTLLVSVDVNFATPDDHAWRVLLEETGISVATPSGAICAEFTALSDRGEPESYLAGRVESSSVDHEEPTLDWSLSWRRQSEPPPDWVVASSARVGGYPAVLRALSSQWPDAVQCEARFLVTFGLDAPRRRPWAGSGWRAGSGPTKRVVSTDSGEIHLHPLASSWLVSPSVRGITQADLVFVSPEEMSQAGRVAVSDLFILKLLGRCVLPMTPQLITSLASRAWDVGRALLKSNGEPPS